MIWKKRRRGGETYEIVILPLEALEPHPSDSFSTSIAPNSNFPSPSSCLTGEDGILLLLLLLPSLFLFNLLLVRDPLLLALRPTKVGRRSHPIVLEKGGEKDFHLLLTLFELLFDGEGVVGEVGSKVSEGGLERLGKGVRRCWGRGNSGGSSGVRVGVRVGARRRVNVFLLLRSAGVDDRSGSRDRDDVGQDFLGEDFEFGQGETGDVERLCEGGRGGGGGGRRSGSGGRGGCRSGSGLGGSLLTSGGGRDERLESSQEDPISDPSTKPGGAKYWMGRCVGRT